MSFLAIEVGTQQYKVFLIEKGKDTLWVRDELVIPMPPDSVKTKIPEMMKDFIRQHHVTDHKVHLTFSDPGVVALRNAVLPAMPHADLVSAIRWHAKEEGTLTEDTALFSYEVGKEFEDTDGAKKVAVLFSVVNRKPLEASILMLNRLGLEVQQVTAAPLNISKVLASAGENSGSQIVLDLGYTSSTCAIYKKGKLFFIRDLSFSFTKTRLSLNDPLFLGEKYRTAEAEKEIDQAIASIGIPGEGTDVAGGERRAAQFFSLMRPLLEGLVREVRYSMTYFMSHLQEEKPAVLFLTGDGARFGNLDRFLTRELGVSVSSLPLPTLVQCDPAVLGKDPVCLNHCVHAVAGVLFGDKSEDFTPLEWKKKKIEALQRGALRLISYIALGFCALSFFFVNLEEAYLKDRLRIGEKQLQSFGSLAQASAKPFLRYYLARQLEQSSIPADRVLRLMAHLMPGELVIRHFEINSARRSLVMDLETAGQDDGHNPLVADLVHRLRETGFFLKLNTTPLAGYSVSVWRVEGVFRND